MTARLPSLTLTRMADTSVTFLERLSSEPDEDSWQRFVDLYGPLIRGWLGRYSVAAEDAEDLAQEVLTVVVRELPRFQHNQQPGAFRNWLRIVAVNQLRLLWRNRRGEAGVADLAGMLDQLADPSSSLSQLWNQEHDRHVTHRLMNMIRPQFEEKTWQAFRRVAIDGLKPAAVAAELGISVNAVLLAKSRILNRLRQELRGLTDD
jgi:RNA polymerase sigma factor (sigma-70 family)